MGNTTMIRNMTWNGSYWLAVSSNAELSKSNDGDTWNVIPNIQVDITDVGNDYDNYAAWQTFSKPVWNGTYWLIPCIINGVGLAHSTDGTNWKFINAFSNSLQSLVWYKNHWIGYGGNDEGASSVATSTDGFNWTYKLFNNNETGSVYFIVVGGAPTEIVTTTLKAVQSNPVATSEGSYLLGYSESTNEIYKSSNGINWTGGNGFSLGNKEHTPFGFHAVWNGSYWFAICIKFDRDHLIYINKSSDGITWTPVNKDLGDFWYIDWNGSYWLGVRRTDIAKSTDGINWTFSTLAGKNLNMAYEPRLKWNGSYWLLCIVDPSSGPNSTISLHKSNDGITWTTISYNNEHGAILNMVWNGSYWLILTNNQLILKSYDAITWTPVKSKLLFNAFSEDLYTSSPYWNGAQWLSSAVDNNVLGVAYSTDGDNWTFTPAFSDGLRALVWYKNSWIAKNNANTGGKSSDGITWTEISNYTPNISYMTVGGAPKQSNSRTITIGGGKSRVLRSSKKKRPSRKKRASKKSV
jgi:hypothetical protein